MKLLPIALFGAFTVTVEALADLKCHQCYGATIQECIDSGTIVTCAKNQESCMIAERKQNGVLMRVRFFSLNITFV